MDDEGEFFDLRTGEMVPLMPARLKKTMDRIARRLYADAEGMEDWYSRLESIEERLESLESSDLDERPAADKEEAWERRSAKRAIDDARIERKRLLNEYNERFVPGPREVEHILLAALSELGYEETVKDLRRKGRPPAGGMSRAARLEWMLGSGDSCLRYSATILPKRTEQRVSGKRSTWGKIPEEELAKLVRLEAGRVGYAEFLGQYAIPELNPEEYLHAIARALAWKLNKLEPELRAYRPRDLVRAYKRFFP